MGRVLLFREQFGLIQPPHDKDTAELWGDGTRTPLWEHFQWLPALAIFRGGAAVMMSAHLSKNPALAGLNNPDNVQENIIRTVAKAMGWD